MSDREKLVVLIMGATYGFGDTKLEIARKLADYLLANGVTVQEWISTDERMPTEDDATDGYVPVIYARVDGVNTKTISLVDVVIAHPDLYDYWMPLNLPQPPKGEKEDVIASIENAPTVDAVEVAHGRWVNERELVGGFNSVWGCDCSECGRTIKTDDGKPNFCPNCGARMEKQI